MAGLHRNLKKMGCRGRSILKLNNAMQHRSHFITSNSFKNALPGVVKQYAYSRLLGAGRYKPV